MYGNWIKESTSTAGTGTITTSAVSSYERFSDVFSVGDLVYYILQDGTQREAGIGTVGASNTLARTTVLETFVSGVRNIASPTAITLSGSGVFVYCDPIMQGLVNPRYGATVASATTTTIWTKDGDVIDVSGTTAITSFGTSLRAGQFKNVRFTGALTLTNGANLILPGAANITTASGDWCQVCAISTTQHAVVSYTKANGNSIVSALLLTGGSMSGAITMTNNNITGLKTAYYNGEYDNGNSGASITIDFANGQCQKVTMNSATPAITISAPPGVGHYQLKLVQDATGTRAPTWAGATYSASRWLNATAFPGANNGNGAQTIINFYYDGTNLYQSLAKVGAI